MTKGAKWIFGIWLAVTLGSLMLYLLAGTNSR